MSICAQINGSNQAVSGLLQPLPVPTYPWSCISLDLVSGLPLSEGNTTILTVVHKVSKMVHFFPLSKLPSKDTAELMLNQVFKLHGFPMDVVLDQGPQFISQFWTAFCTLLGASESLSSGQTERLNQEIEKGLRCLAFHTPSLRSRQFVRVEYTHNSVPCAS